MISDLQCYVAFISLKGGLYVFEMFDIQSGGISLVLIALLETIAIAWVYGEKSKLECYCFLTLLL